MIAHVAEAGEGRGRIVLRVDAGRVSPLAIEAAILAAQAWSAEIETLSIEDANLVRLAGYDGVPELLVAGRRTTVRDGRAIVRDLFHALKSAQRSVEQMVRTAGVPMRSRFVVDEPLQALSLACAEDGPWNVIALAGPVDARAMGRLGQLLESIAGVTGLIVVGANATRSRGPVIAAIEDGERLGSMLRVAERLAAVNEERIEVMLVATDEVELIALEGEARLALADHHRLSITAARCGYGDPAVIAESIRLRKPGFVVAQRGGLVMPDDDETSPLAGTLECPLMVVR